MTPPISKDTSLEWVSCYGISVYLFYRNWLHFNQLQEKNGELLRIGFAVVTVALLPVF
jgi:hypothetical protein